MDEEDPPNLNKSDLESTTYSAYFDLFGEVPDIPLPHEFLARPPDPSTVTITEKVFETLEPIAFYNHDDSSYKASASYEETKKPYKNQFSLAA